MVLEGLRKAIEVRDSAAGDRGSAVRARGSQAGLGGSQPVFHVLGLGLECLELHFEIL